LAFLVMTAPLLGEALLPVVAAALTSRALNRLRSLKEKKTEDEDED
jgi:hypothetical protein